jgi:hypothetical protein
MAIDHTKLVSMFPSGSPEAAAAAKLLERYEDGGGHNQRGRLDVSEAERLGTAVAAGGANMFPAEKSVAPFLAAIGKGFVQGETASVTATRGALLEVTYPDHVLISQLDKDFVELAQRLQQTPPGQAESTSGRLELSEVQRAMSDATLPTHEQDSVRKIFDRYFVAAATLPVVETKHALAIELPEGITARVVSTESIVKTVRRSPAYGGLLNREENQLERLIRFGAIEVSAPAGTRVVAAWGHPGRSYAEDLMAEVPESGELRIDRDGSGFYDSLSLYFVKPAATAGLPEVLGRVQVTLTVPS